MANYLKALNPVQLKAVKCTSGPVMVIAGAGSGKTRVLTYRIAYLMESGVDPFNILSLTFTNKAAREMKERVERLIHDSDAKNLWMGTFHSVFAKILRIEGYRLGFPSSFTIYDAEDSRKVISDVIKELGLEKEIYKAKNISSRISTYKNNLITPKIYSGRAELQESDSAARIPKLGEIYSLYMERCFRSGAMDFDDLLLKTNELFLKFPEILLKYQERFKYILVDEYQDTNHSQYLIVKALASRYENICVVGDDAQSIYAFRGANIRNILNFQKDYDQAKLFKLEQNYRSTEHIVKAANSLIKKNKDQLEKNIWTSNPQGDKIIIHKSVSDSDEGNYAAKTIWEKNIKEHIPFDNFAILYRTNAQSRAFEDSLRRKNIPYRIFGGLSFYQRKEVKDLISYLRLIANQKDDEAFKRIINLPARGIGETTLARLKIAANEHETSLWEAAINSANWELKINKPTVDKLLAFCDLIKSYKIISLEKNAFELVENVARTSGIIKFLSDDKTPEGVMRYENVQELLNGIKNFVEEQQQIENGNPGIEYFLEDIALITEADRNQKDERPKVNLMTIHLAKGLEFENVFIVGMEENLFPSMMSLGSRDDLEEERRLFYVAITRAKKSAFLTYSHIRYRWGKLIDCEPSRFLEELDEKHLNIDIPNYVPNHLAHEKITTFNVSSKNSKTNSYQQKNRQKKTSIPNNSVKFKRPHNLKPIQKNHKLESPFNQINSSLVSGNRVIHDRFGSGTIKEISGENMDQKATIIFDNVGEKKLLLKFAKLELIK
jgi:DNA helicase-2/ATP-dependent DNA helicase PcrA